VKKDFDEYFDEVIGTLQLTKNERIKYKKSLMNTLKRWEIKGLIEEGELPERGTKRIQEWMMDMDKSMVVQMVGSVEKRIMNYRRKIFGLVGTSPQKQYIAYMVNEMMKEGMPIHYLNQEVIDKFFTGEGIE
jgi:hypothetical protein|tara:strand:+ start:438 stop:833 length:396 start_codon:yes stop_codon:yes gene_type:complete